MKAFVLRSYGSPEVLDLRDIDKPVPGDDEVLVRVRATSVNPYDWHSMRGEPFIARLTGMGLRNPKIRILGADMAGQVEAVAGHSLSGVWTRVPAATFFVCVRYSRSRCWRLLVASRAGDMRCWRARRYQWIADADQLVGRIGRRKGAGGHLARFT